MVELDIRGLFLSEHGTTNSHPEHEQACKEAGIKPGYGVEIYFAPPQTRSKFHLGIYAMNEEGYRNLSRIVTQSYIDSYQYPTVHWEVLEKYSKGLAVLSGCSDSLLSCTLLGGKSLGPKRDTISDKQFDLATRRIKRFQDIFEDRFYLEVQRFPGLERTCLLNPAYAELSRITGAALFATADIHYPYAYQNEMQKVLHAGRNKSSVAIVDAEWEYDVVLTYPETDEELYADLCRTGLSFDEAHAAIENTSSLCDKATVELPKAEPLRFRTDGTKNAKQQLAANIRSGLKRRLEQRPDLEKRLSEYKKRIDYEFGIVAGKDFSDYFLVVADLINWAKSENIDIGPGRGSGAGSLICYVLGITEIDPLHPTFQRMIFERFIDPNRSDMPDLDIDVHDERRMELVDRAIQIYGNENVCNVANHQDYRGKSALAAVARAYGLPAGVFEPIGKRCDVRVETDESRDDSIADVVNTYSTSPDVAEILEKYPDQIRLAQMLEGSPDTIGRHAGGFVISSQPIPDVCPIVLLNVDDEGTDSDKKIPIQVMPYEKRNCEYLNMLKIDFLGLATMGMIGKVREWTDMSLDNLYAMYYRDYEDGQVFGEQIFEKFRSDDVMGIFQYEGGTTRQVVREVQPDNFDELAACGALSRPGPFYGGQTKDYIAVKRGDMDWKRIHETGFDRHVEWTYGQIVYQEQIMWILRDLAGFDVGKVLKVRKIIGKKLGEFQFAALWAEFRDGCANNGVSEADALGVWGAITTAAGYAFNTAHAYSYALVAWWQMFFKIYREKQFFAASLYKNGDLEKNIPRRTALLQDAISHGHTIGRISVWNSDVNWRPGEISLIPGFTQIPKVGLTVAENIVRWRDERKAKQLEPTWDDMVPPPAKGGLYRMGATTVEKIKTFVEQDDPFRVFATEKQLGAFREQLKRGDYERFGLPGFETFVRSGFNPTDTAEIAFVGLVTNVVERDEAQTIRTRTGRPIDEIRAELEERHPNTKKATIFAYDEWGEVALRCSRFRYLDLETRIGAIKKNHHIVVGYGKIYKDRANSVQLTNLWVLNPD